MTSQQTKHDSDPVGFELVRLKKKEQKRWWQQSQQLQDDASRWPGLTAGGVKIGGQTQCEGEVAEDDDLVREFTIGLQRGISSRNP
jgi:hypothetical protein